MAGKTAWTKLGLTSPEGNRLASTGGSDYHHQHVGEAIEKMG